MTEGSDLTIVAAGPQLKERCLASKQLKAQGQKY